MSANISQVFERADKAGIRFGLDSEGVLLVESDKTLTEQQRAWISEHKAALLESLRAGGGDALWLAMPSRVLGWLCAQPGRRGQFDDMAAALGLVELEQRTEAALHLSAFEQQGVVKFEYEPMDAPPGWREWITAYPDMPKNPFDGVVKGTKKGPSARR